jgi:prepilin-type N-terminal cleavage/methylation domain-containing protein
MRVMKARTMQEYSPKIESGFSLLELIVAVAITLVIMGAASSLLASSFKIRSREDSKSDAVADVQRAFNSMSREIGNAGFKLPGSLTSVSSNGIVGGDSDSQSIRIVSNLNGADGTDTDVDDADEDVKFLMYVDNTLGQRYLVRYEKNATNTTTVLANRIDSLVIRYYDEKVTYDTTLAGGVADITNVRNSAGNTKAEVSPGAAKYIVLAVGVVLPAVGTPGVDGYQPASEVQLTSDITLRNSITY